jgi:hypothetical protein
MGMMPVPPGDQVVEGNVYRSLADDEIHHTRLSIVLRQQNNLSARFRKEYKNAVAQICVF